MAVSDDSVLVGNSAYNTISLPQINGSTRTEKVHKKVLEFTMIFFILEGMTSNIAHICVRENQYKIFHGQLEERQFRLCAIKFFQSATFKYSRKPNIMVTVEYSTKPFHTLHLSIVKNKLADQSKSLIFCSCGWSHKDFQTLRLYCVYISEGSFEIFYYTSNILYILMFR